MEQVKRIKIAMICHFSNHEIREHLPLSENRKLYSIARKILHMPVKGKGYGDLAPWDSETINYFRNRNDIELYVISAHSGLKRRVVSFDDKGIHYSFVRCVVATMLKQIIPNSNLWIKLNPMVKDVHHLVNQFKPDLVLLMGLENAHYSSTVLGIKDYPVFGLCQTIYNNPERAIYDSVDNKNADTEMRIFKEHKYFGVYCRKHYDLLKPLAPDASIFKFGFPSNGLLLEPTRREKKYDFVNFAVEMSVKKGFTDAIEAIAIVKKKHFNVKLNLVGGGQKAPLIALAEKLGVKDNVVFTSFFAKREDMFYHIQQARFALLPCKMDNTSGTMTQSMQLGLPMVVYKTKGTPSFNKEKECVLIAELGNVEDLATKMLELMENPEKAEMIRKNAREFQEKKFVFAKHNGEHLIDNFKAIINNYKNGTPIPQKQLFNPKTDD